MHSCIYEGTVSHSRREPVAHGFEYRLFMVSLDLDELPSILGAKRLIADRSPAWCSFQSSDHLAGNRIDLRQQVRELVFERTGRRTSGPIRLLTQLRYCGLYFSPLNLFYVYDESDSRVEFVVAEVNNTPWNERHCYVLWEGNRQNGDSELRFSHPKDFHVSPFMDMEMQYRWRLTQPADDVSIHLANVENQRTIFSASMTLERRELNRQQLRRMLLCYPLMTAKISAAIYYQAFKLWWKKCPLYTHPKNKSPLPSQRQLLPAQANKPTAP